MSGRRTGVVLVALLFALVGLAGCTGAAPAVAATGVTVFGQDDRKPAPDLTGDLLGGSGSYKLADHRGEVVVINFWASWCAPCVAEADDLEATYQATKDQKVSFVGINTHDDADSAKTFVLGRFTYPSVFDPSGKLAMSFAVAPTAIPATIIVDRQGRIAAAANTSLLREDLESAVTTLAAESS